MLEYKTFISIGKKYKEDIAIANKEDDVSSYTGHDQEKHYIKTLNKYERCVVCKQGMLFKEAIHGYYVACIRDVYAQPIVKTNALRNSDTPLCFFLNFSLVLVDQ